MGLSRYIITVPANTERDLNVTGAWVYVVAASALFELGVDQGATGEVEAGTYWEPARPFRLVRIRNTTGAANTVELKIGDGHFEDRRGEGGGAAGIDPASLGDVRAYAFRGQRACEPAAGDRGHLQLWNPPGSGVRAAVRELYITTNVGGRIALFDWATALDADTPFRPRSCWFGDPDGALEWRQTKQAGSIGITGQTNLVVVHAAPNSFMRLPLKSPLVIPPGWGLVARHTEVGPLRFDMGFDLLELPDT